MEEDYSPPEEDEEYFTCPLEVRARIAARNRKAIEKLERSRDTGVEPTDVPDQGKDA